MRGVITYYPNEEVFKIAVRRQISNYFFAQQSKGRELGYEDREKVGELGCSIGSALLSVEGVTEVSLRPYEVSIHVATAFTRMEVASVCVLALEQLLGCVLEIEEQDWGGAPSGDRVLADPTPTSKGGS